jgi:serine/threonine protein phosphatase PrpC
MNPITEQNEMTFHSDNLSYSVRNKISMNQNDPNISEFLDQKPYINVVASSMRGYGIGTEDDYIIDKLSEIPRGYSLYVSIGGMHGVSVSQFIKQNFINIMKNTKSWQKMLQTWQLFSLVSSNVPIQNSLNKNYIIKPDMFEKIISETFAELDFMLLTQLSINAETISQKTNTHNLYDGTDYCALTVLFITPSNYIIGNVGNNRAVIVRDRKGIDIIKHTLKTTCMGAHFVKYTNTHNTPEYTDPEPDPEPDPDTDKFLKLFSSTKNRINESYITCKPDIHVIDRSDKTICHDDDFIILTTQGISEQIISTEQLIFNLYKTKDQYPDIIETITANILSTALNNNSQQYMQVILIDLVNNNPFNKYKDSIHQSAFPIYDWTSENIRDFIYNYYDVSADELYMSKEFAALSGQQLLQLNPYDLPKFDNLSEESIKIISAIILQLCLGAKSMTTNDVQEWIETIFITQITNIIDLKQLFKNIDGDDLMQLSNDKIIEMVIETSPPIKTKNVSNIQSTIINEIIILRKNGPDYMNSRVTVPINDPTNDPTNLSCIII